MDIVATYLRELRDIHASGSAVRETSYYGPLASLLNNIGKSLKPRVRCVVNLQNRGAGIPDGGLFSADQLQRGESEMLPGQLPSRGVLEVKGAGDDVTRIARGEQVTRYLGTYGQVLVTNYRDFLLMGRDEAGRPQERERFTLATTEAAFWTAARDPEALAEAQGERLVEYLKRVMLSNAPLTRPQDLAWFLASYARDARALIDRTNLPAHDRSRQVVEQALARVRQALEEALGITFEEERGDHFFRSTLIQTLFYGVFSAWVLWHNERPERTDRFDWRVAGHYLHVPVIQALFGQISQPNRLRPLGLNEVLDWTGAVLNRVDRATFFSAFDAGQAVQYFYEPFLEAFDPELRRQLGVWYTPPEVIRYMVARVDTVLREELDIADGLADPRVHVLDPCCGTGAYIVEVLQHIEVMMREQGEEALLGYKMKQVALSRVFGFELLPAPFVVAHLQVGLFLQHLGAPLRDDEERAKIFLTNALTGWEPPDEARRRYMQQRMEFLPELQEERDSAAQVKRDAPILVILGNPPYSAFAGIAMGEERDLSTAYRTAQRAPMPQGQGLNDLYVRFFRMAERRIVDQSGQGVVCYISNYSWLNGLSHTGMRERYLESFDRIWIDSLNGDKYRTGKLTPEGEPDPSVFSTEFNAEGIQVGTAIALMVRKGPHAGDAAVSFRNFWGRTKRTQLLDALSQPAAHPYLPLDPPAPLGFPLEPAQVGVDYLNWPQLPDVFPTAFPGVKTSRDDVVVGIDREDLVERMQRYFDPQVSHAEMRRIAPGVMESTSRFQAEPVREQLRRRGFLTQNVVRYCYRPFDVRWLYWEPETKLLDEKRAEYYPHAFQGNIWFSAGQRNRKDDFYQPQVTSVLADHHIVESNVGMFPLYLRSDGAPRTLFDLGAAGDVRELGEGRRLNLSDGAVAYLNGIGSIADAELLFHHAIAALHAPAYREENAGALRQDWPRLPLPATREALEASAVLGRQLAALLDSERPLDGVTRGSIRPELRPIAVLTAAGGRQINPDAGDLDVTAGWGFAGRGGITMPGRGKVVERAATETEVNAALGVGPGTRTYDIYLNDHVYWRNVPPRVWEYTIGGYQVIKKWLSYRERPLLGRGLTPEEAIEVTQIARRIAAILLLEPALDANYRAVAAATYLWGGEGVGE